MKSRIILTSIFIAFTLSLIALANPSWAADVKLAFLNSDRVLQEYKEYQEAYKEYEKMMADWRSEAQDREREILDMRDQIEKQSMLWTEERKAEMQRKVTQREEDYKRFVEDIFSDKGKGVQKQLELAQPIFDKINALLNEISVKEGYTMIFDTVSGNVLYADPELDLTNMLIEKLNKIYDESMAGQTPVEDNPAGETPAGEKTDKPDAPK